MNFNFIPQSKKTIGILGGMGPAASALLYQRLIVTAQKKYHAEQDTDFPPIFIYNLPLIGFDETGFTDPLLVREQLIHGVEKLAAAGSDFVIIACNTAHYFSPAMQSAIPVPIISIIDETVKQVAAAHYSSVGVISSASTAKLLVYQQALENNGIRVIGPSAEEQLILNEVILHVMMGIPGVTDITNLKQIITHLEEQGAEAIILGCTELPLAIDQSHIALPLFDTIQVITEAALERTFSGN